MSRRGRRTRADSNNSVIGLQGAKMLVRMSVAGANGTTRSAAQIPAGSIVTFAKLDFQNGSVLTGAAPTVKVGSTAVTNLLIDTPDFDPLSAQVNDARQATPWGALTDNVVVTVAGATGGGPFWVLVEAQTPQA